MTEKMDRVQLLVGRLAKELNLPSDVVVTAQRAASIYKFDLVTNMTEFLNYKESWVKSMP